MLKGIPQILSPELLMVLCEMGHGDRLVISDGNFPAESMGKDAIVIRCDGHGVPELLDAILQLVPLDTYVEKPVTLMEVVHDQSISAVSVAVASYVPAFVPALFVYATCAPSGRVPGTVIVCSVPS